METFWQYGYEATSLTLLKAAMGINSPSLYAAFGNKDALFTQAITLYLNKYGAYREAALIQAPTAREGIKILFEQTLDLFFSSEHHRGCLVVLSALTGSQDSQPIRTMLREERRKTARLFEQRLQADLHEGDNSQDQKARILAEYFTTVLFGLSVQVKDGVSRQEAQHIVDLALTVLDQ